VQLETMSGVHWALTNPGGDSTASSFVSRIPFAAGSPATNAVGGANGIVSSGDGVIAMGSDGGIAPICLQLLGIGVGSTTTFKTNVYGWCDTPGNFINEGGGTAPAGSYGINQKLWIPLLLATYTWTLGTAAGIAGSDIGTTELFATTVVTTFGPVYGTGPAQSMQIAYGGGGQIYSPGSNAIAMVELLIEGFRFVEVTFNMNSSSTSANCLYRKK
jgi:hypothetical protein